MSEQFPDFERVSTWIDTVDDAVEAIKDHAQYYDTTILGAPQKSRLQRFVSDSLTNNIYRMNSNTVIVAKRATDSTPRYHQWVSR